MRMDTTLDTPLYQINKRTLASVMKYSLPQWQQTERTDSQLYMQLCASTVRVEYPKGCDVAVWVNDSPHTVLSLGDLLRLIADARRVVRFTE